MCHFFATQHSPKAQSRATLGLPAHPALPGPVYDKAEAIPYWAAPRVNPLAPQVYGHSFQKPRLTPARFHSWGLFCFGARVCVLCVLRDLGPNFLTPSTAAVVSPAAIYVLGPGAKQARGQSMARCGDGGRGH